MKNSSFSLNRFLWFGINYSRNWECFDQSCVNRPESVHGSLRFLFLSHLLYGIFIMNRYMSKSYTTTKNTIDLQYTERGQLRCQLLLVIAAPGLAQSVEPLTTEREAAGSIPRAGNTQGLKITQKWRFAWLGWPRKIAVLSPVKDVKIVFPISTFMLNTFTLK